MKIPALLIQLMILSSSMCLGQMHTAPADHQGPAVIFNQKVIDGLHSRSVPDDPEAVFSMVFSALDTEVNVYPTENYYYFQLYTSGTTYWGNLRLDAKDRDDGIIHIGYFRFDDNGNSQDREGNEKALSSGDSVFVKKLQPLAYSVTFSGKTVIFRLNDICSEHPLLTSLSPSERFVGPIFDESGLKFFLLFNTRLKHFMYMLNENGAIPEYFKDLGDYVVEGSRTGFMFYQDTLFDRKILLAVCGRSTDRNNWYDGPFDQLPDNCVESTNIREYIEDAYHYTRGNVDKFGGFRDQPGARVVIFPYSVYYQESEVTDLVRTTKEQGLSPEEFLVKITPDPYENLGKE